MRSKKGVPIVVVVVLLAAVGAFQACGGTAAKPCVMNMHGKLVEEAKLFKLDVYGSSVHCKGNSVPTDSGQPLKSQSFMLGSPIRLDIAPGQYALVLTTFSDLTAMMPTGSACLEKKLEPGGNVCFDLMVTPYVRGCPADATRCMNVCCANGTCDAACNVTCSDGFADCNNDLADGCETNLANAGLRLCNGSCINANSCCTSNDCTTPPAGGLPAACQLGNCPSPGGTCTYAPKTTAVVCGANSCCSATNGVCNKNDCSISCTANSGNCNNDPSDGCEANLLNDLNNCGSCGHACAVAGQDHVVTPACVTGSCAPSACATGYRSCGGNKSPDDGCECATPDCCGSFCQTIHDTGFRDAKNQPIPFYDCDALGDVTNERQATNAANGYNMYFVGGTGTLKTLKTGGDLPPYVDPTDSGCTVTGAVCLQTATDCPCWTWQSVGTCHNHSEGYARRDTSHTCIPATNTAAPNVPWL